MTARRAVTSQATDRTSANGINGRQLCANTACLWINSHVTAGASVWFRTWRLPRSTSRHLLRWLCAGGAGFHSRPAQYHLSLTSFTPQVYMKLIFHRKQIFVRKVSKIKWLASLTTMCFSYIGMVHQSTNYVIK